MYLTRDQVRALDRRAIQDFGVPGIVLMENAGRVAAELLRALGITGSVLVCCGKGNNGGDGFVIARHLDNQRVPVRVVLLNQAQDLAGDAAIAYRIIARSGIAIWPFNPEVLVEGLVSADWVVDALYGTGLQGAVRSPADQVIRAINASGKKVLAVDVPSGLDCDTGRPLGIAVHATHTATFVAPKKGFREQEAQAWLGQVHVLDIGVPRKLIEGYDRGAGQGSQAGAETKLNR
jgi:NAD(P)H-hydrate epimerase